MKISSLSRLLLLVAAVCLVISLFVPLWRIELDAPQYPEGLALQMYPHGLAGDVNIINGLNHYIGMATLHTEDFMEFTILPYLIGAFAALFFLAALVGRRQLLWISFIAFVLFGTISMIDFWRWEYNYGHNLDPNAAIIVPGMAYQPPLIGFKQLLNFGAYSIPDIGGWLFVAAGLLVLIALLRETGVFSRFSGRSKAVAAVAPLLLFLASCGNTNAPDPIKLNADNCDYCKMTIADGRFAAETITGKGRKYKFDDLSCLKGYQAENTSVDYKSNWVCNFNKPLELLNVENAVFVQSEAINSPMGGNTAAFENKAAAGDVAEKMGAAPVGWNETHF